jgi:DNA-binding HxlR family transcriptional regulator
MTGPRTYGDPCGVARALDAVGERWALLVVRELAFGPKRFTDLRAALGASPNVLSQRLSELEDDGVVERRSAGGALYELTEWGRELHPILIQLGRWGARSGHRPKGALGVDALMLALEATFVPERAAGLSASYELWLGEERLSVHVDRKTVAIARARPNRPDAVIETDSETLRAVAFGDRKLAGAPIEMGGDVRVARAFFRLFERPK